MNVLDNHSPIPLYHQLKAFIEGQIETGVWNPGDRVPSESDLGMQFHVSRTTVRQALGDLVNQGLLSRAQGKGTFVAPPRIQQPLTRLTGFTQDMAQRLKRPSSRVLKLDSLPASAQVAAALQIAAGDLVVALDRLRLADGAPMAVEIGRICFPGCEELLQEDLSNHSLYQILGEKWNIHPSRARQRMEATACPAETAALLEIRKGSPVLHIYRTTFDQHGRPFEQVESFYRGDRYVFQVELSSE